MTKDIQIGDKMITFTANGATPLWYKQFFHKDLLKTISVTDDEMSIATENLPELAFIMAKQADKADMMNLKFEHYVEWLSLFNAFDITLKGDEIFRVYIADAVPTEEPKKKAGKPKE